MKVVMISTSFPRYPGDRAGHFIYGLAHALRQRGMSVTVIAPDDVAAPSRQEEWGGVHIIRFRYFFPARWQCLAYGAGMLSNLRSYVLAWLQLPSYLAASMIVLWGQARQADLIHAHWSFSGIIALVVGRLIRCPVVLTAHGSDVLGLSGLAQRISYAVFRHAGGVIAVSREIQQKMHSAGVPPERCWYIPNAVVDSERLFAIPRPYRPIQTIIWVGRLAPEKNIFLLLDAFAALQAAQPHLRLRIVGDGPERRRAEAYIHAQGLDQCVTFVGNCSTEAMLDQWRQPDICISTSTREGMPLVVLEAMAAGVLVVAPLVGGIRDIIENDYSGFVYTHHVASDIVARCTAVLQLSAGERAAVIASARARIARDHTWSIVAGHTQSVYDRVYGKIRGIL